MWNILFRSAVLGVMHNASFVINYFFQVTSKVTHYFLIYEKISELLF